jgi:hypothetical protein
MRSILKFAVSTGCVLAVTAPLAAQAGQWRPPSVNQRQAAQQRRILEGVKDGEISLREYYNLQRRSYAIEAQQRRDRRDGGGLSWRERYELNRRLDHLGRKIYRDRND